MKTSSYQKHFFSPARISVRPYLLSVCQSEQKQIDEHARVIEEYKTDTNKVQQRIHELQSQALTLNQTKCAGIVLLASNSKCLKFKTQ